MRSTLLLLAFIAFSIHTLKAQQLPKTNIYHFNIEQRSDSLYSFTKPLYLTGFNSEGYNNQPTFVSDHEIYLTVQMADDTTQTDIYSLNLKTKTKTQITATADSEYSPMRSGVRADSDTPAFSCVRVENDGENTQRLWGFPMNRSNNGQPIFEKVKGVGYHTWVTPTKAALFIVGNLDNPHRLVIADESWGRVENITANIGRCLQRMPNGNLAFVHKMGDNSWLLKKLNVNSKRPELITAMINEKEDFAIMPDGTFIMGSGSKLYKFNQKKDNSWVEIADFKYYGINNITRLAIRNGKQIAIVSK